MIVSETANRTLSPKLMARVLSCVIVVVPVGLAAADDQSGVKGDPEGWEQVDTNGDGLIDAKEAQVIADNATSQQAASVKPITAEQILGFMDTNRDGKISKAEWAALITFQVNSQKAGSKERKAAERIVSSMDANKDGKISKDEASALVKPYFEQIDTNGDGFIDVNEAWGMAYSASSQQLQGRVTAEQIVGYLDRNFDGKISKDETSEELKPYFEQIDTNKDEVIDVKEAQVMADYVNSQQGQGRVTAKQIVSYMDKNGDGKISKDEASEELKPHFEQIDANKDEVIDVKEAQVMADYVNGLQGQVTAEQILSSMDKNGDGRISEAELDAGSRFQYLNANGDGFIDAKEAQVIADNATSQQAASVKPITAEQILGFMDTNRDGKISKAEWAAMAAFQANSQRAETKERMAAEKIVSSMDPNRDGKISKDEISTVLKPYFEQIDTNGDGFIDAKEAWGMAYSASSR